LISGKDPSESMSEEKNSNEIIEIKKTWFY